MPNNRLIEFYDRCEQEGILDLDDAYKERKAEQIASLLNIDVSDGIISVFSDAKKEAVQKREEERIAYKRETEEAAIRFAKEHDPKEFELLNKYSDIYGNKKIIEMTKDKCQEEIKPLLDEYNKIDNQAKENDYYSKAARQLALNPLEKEKDWAVAGGIANGIAGGAAGLATALDTQMKNAEIRARNREFTQQMVQTEVQLSLESMKNRDKANRVLDDIKRIEKQYQDQIKAYETRVIGDEDDERVFKSINVNNISYSITPIGSVKVKCSVLGKDKCTVFGTHPAFIDGSLMAKIFQNENLIGVANMVFPIEGLRSESVTLEGISLCQADVNSPCHIEIIPGNLWKMEA